MRWAVFTHRGALESRPGCCLHHQAPPLVAERCSTALSAFHLFSSPRLLFLPSKTVIPIYFPVIRAASGEERRFVPSGLQEPAGDEGNCVFLVHLQSEACTSHAHHLVALLTASCVSISTSLLYGTSVLFTLLLTTYFGDHLSPWPSVAEASVPRV